MLWSNLGVRPEGLIGYTQLLAHYMKQGLDSSRIQYSKLEGKRVLRTNLPFYTHSFLFQLMRKDRYTENMHCVNQCPLCGLPNIPNIMTFSTGEIEILLGTFRFIDLNHTKGYLTYLSKGNP